MKLAKIEIIKDQSPEADAAYVLRKLNHQHQKLLAAATALQRLIALSALDQASQEILRTVLRKVMADLHSTTSAIDFLNITNAE